MWSGFHLDVYPQTPEEMPTPDFGRKSQTPKRIHRVVAMLDFSGHSNPDVRQESLLRGILAPYEDLKVIEIGQSQTPRAR